MVTGKCKVCNNTTGNGFFVIKEMQLGLREEFIYMQCPQCNSLQLQNIPANLGKYYPNNNYYSFNRDIQTHKKPNVLRKLKSSYLLYGKNVLLGGLLSIGYKVPAYYSWMKAAGVHYNDSILDVGTGNGSLLFDLSKTGFTNLTGIDPFIDQEQQYGPIHIHKKSIFEMEDRFDYIMLHHAFEHMDEPLKVLLQLNKLLKKERYLLIRTPVMDMYSWKKYKEHWVDIDAPRHIIIHSLKSMQILASQAGFELRKIIYDGNYMSLIGSDQYTKNIALSDENSYIRNKKTTIYTQKDIDRFKAINDKNNIDQCADQAAFYLYKS